MTPQETEVRTMRVTREQVEAIGQAASIVSRMGCSYEVYGGVDIESCLARIDELDAAWFDARSSARLETEEGEDG